MKKILVIVLALAMVFTMFACGKEATEEFNYPTQPVTIICPYSISGGTGTMSNLLADYLSKKWGVAVNVVEQSGGSGTVGTSVLAASANDGYTLLVVGAGALVISPFATGVNYAADDLEMVCQISESYTIMSVSQNADKYHSWEEIYAAASANPGTVTVSSSGSFGAHHIAIELLSLALTGKTGLFLHMPENGGAASCTQVIGGHYDAVVGIISEQSKYFGLEKDGLVCVLQMTKDPASSTLFPDVPTCGDLGIDATGGTWYMVVAPKGTDPEILDFLDENIYEALQDANVKEKFENSNNPVVYLNRADAQAKYEAEYASGKTVVDQIK